MTRPRDLSQLINGNATIHFEVGYTTDAELLTSNTITPDFQKENLKQRAVTGNVTINAPTTGNGLCHIKLAADGSGPYTVTLGTNVTALGIIPDLEASTTYIATVIRWEATKVYVQIIEAG